jgi:predicted amidohydrolase YtcJ
MQLGEPVVFNASLARNFDHFCENVLPDIIRAYSIVKKRRAKSCITYVTIAAIFFSGESAAAHAWPAAADLVLINGNVRTLDRSNPQVEALAVSGGRIAAVGSNAEIRKLIGERTRVIDAKGKLVLPGFNDAHVHFAAIGNKFSSIDLRTARSSEEIAARLAEYSRFLPKGRWILGGGFDRGRIGESGSLRRLADAVTRDNPVFLYSADAKTAFANRAALAKARITRHTPDPAGGSIGRDAAGEPDGILTGSVMRLVGSTVPADHSKNWPEILETATNYSASLGVTSVQDMSTDDMADVYRQLDRAGKLKTRIYDCVGISAVSKLAGSGVRAATGDAMVRTGCVKYFSEGDEAELPQLMKDIASADKAGLQVMIHAIGPEANRITLDAFEWTAKTNGSRDRRFRVEHAHNAAADLPRFASLGVVASMQPWLFHNGGPTAFRRHLQLRTSLAFGSDAPIVDLNPLLGIYAAASGTNGLSIEEAVRSYTTGSAFAEFQEKVKGTIAPGKLADIVILSDNIFARDFSRKSNVVVLVTIVNGKIVYESDQPKGGASENLGFIGLRNVGGRPGCRPEMDLACEPERRSDVGNAHRSFGAERK